MDGHDEQYWLFRRHARWYGRVPQGEVRAEPLPAHIQRHREQGGRLRGGDRGLSREEIVRAAVAIADAGGAEAISMRRIARELRVGAMSLYWHIGSKEELIDAMRESVEAEMKKPGPSGDWRGDLRTLARGQRDGMLRHPWMMDFLGSGPPTGLGDADDMERILALFDQLGLGPAVTMNLVTTLIQYMTGAVLREIREIREIRGEEAQELAGLELAQGERDDRFEFGLDIVLDGIAAQLRLALVFHEARLLGGAPKRKNAPELG